MNIYFTAAKEGDVALYTDIVRMLSRYGEVATEHIAKKGLSKDGEVSLLDEEIYERDMTWLAHADVIVAEVTTPSLGVGYGVARAETMEKPILCLYRIGSENKLSAMIAGNPNIHKEAYESLEDVAEILDNFLRME